MTLLITVFAAVIATVVWYRSEEDILNVKMLAIMFWGASLMWLADAIFEYAELHEAYFTPALEDMINDSFLGLSVIALASVIWVVTLLVKDPKGTFKKEVLKEAMKG